MTSYSGEGIIYIRRIFASEILNANLREGLFSRLCSFQGIFIIFLFCFVFFTPKNVQHLWAWKTVLLKTPELLRLHNEIQIMLHTRQD